MSDYPDSADLHKIEHWKPMKPWSGARPWLPILGLMEDAWNMDMGSVRWNDAKTEATFVTGGWSGNEDIIEAMHGNFSARSILWQSSHRGGKFIYGVGEK